MRAKNENETITHAELKELLSYDEGTGLFRWRKKRGMAPKNSIAGTIKPQGYRLIRIKLHGYMAGRLAWFYVYGYWPNTIDHINHDRRDDRISNLRDIDEAENARNQSMRKNNSSGYNGVKYMPDRKKWAAQINVNNRRIHLGFFSNIGDAAKARAEANAKYGFHENHGL